MVRQVSHCQTFTAAERRQLDEARILLQENNYPTAAHAVDEALRFDSQERDAKDTFRIEDESE